MEVDLRTDVHWVRRAGGRQVGGGGGSGDGSDVGGDASGGRIQHEGRRQADAAATAATVGRMSWEGHFDTSYEACNDNGSTFCPKKV